MPKKVTQNYLSYFLTIATGVVLLFIPLLGDLHIESAMLATVIGCFWGGFRACRGNPNADFRAALRIIGYLFLAGLPLLVNAILTECLSIHGLAFWLLFPPTGVYFGYAIGRLLRSFQLSFRRLLLTTILLALGIGIFLYEFFHYPQVYFFNHVWGVWPGPIYDETVKLTKPMVFFRALTISWILLLWHIPAFSQKRYAQWIVGLSAIALLFGYTQLTKQGVLTPRSYIQEQLGGHKTTEHFELYYDQRLYSEYEINKLAAEHEFYLQQITDALTLPSRGKSNKIESYLYGHPWQKKELVGAKFTSYVPIWLQQDQLHIAKQQTKSSLKHELVHVLAKRFGNRLFNGSWSIGLIEGLAVAIDGGSSSTSTIDQIVVSEQPYPTAKELQHSFSLLGFYGGRSGVNYITSGSFIRYLMNEYPISLLKEAYRTADIAASYGKDWQVLANGWHRHLDSISVDSADQQTASRIFRIPSLFEQACPHVLSNFAARWDEYRFLMASHDTTQALAALDDALAAADSVASVKIEWSFRQLVAGKFDKVNRVAALQDTTVEQHLLYADAFAMNGDIETARQYLRKARQLFNPKQDSLLKPGMQVRQDDWQWNIYRQLRYQNYWPDSVIFAKTNYHIKIRTLKKAIKEERWELVEQYGRQLLQVNPRKRYVDEYLLFIHELALQGNHKLAEQWRRVVSKLSLRRRQAEQLQNERGWLKFMSK
ncbi:hypothetical protein LX73_1539 [Fodinibius salinus]|uniref:Peptidase MA superfamily protein n=1 Tax=Fodinibius salinus TaxID=860790 RepID=A0A5D3YLN8_9BACT|nr:hypothetical protein [Fodinibius salinus]TYP93826.1 hypothetical protein LX73_1539 [Fodinibius salinus]